MATNFDEEDEGETGTESDALRAQAATMTAYAQGVRALALVPPEQLADQIEILARSFDTLAKQLEEQAITLDKQMIAALRRGR